MSCSCAAVCGTIGGSADRPDSHAEQIVGTQVPHVRGQGSLPGQGSPASGKRISERIVEQIVGFPEQTVEQIVDTSPCDGCGQGASSSAGLADEDFTVGFSHFSSWKKKVRSAGQVSADLPRHVSSWTPAAYGQPSGSIEQEKEKEKELKAEKEEDEDPTGWNLAFDEYGRQYFWHRRTRRTAWEIPESAMLRMKGVRKRKKRKKKKLPRGGRALRRLWQCHIRAPRVVFPSYVGRPQLPGIIVGMGQYFSLLRARHRHWQWHFQGWFCWFLFALCSFRSSSGPGCFASWPVWTRRTVLLFLVFLCGFTRVVRSILVLLSVLLVLPVTTHCALALLGVVLEFIAECGYGADGKDCALAILGLVLVFTAACNTVVCAWFLGCRRGEDSHSTRGEDGLDPTVAARWWRSAWKGCLARCVQDRRVSRQCRNLLVSARVLRHGRRHFCRGAEAVSLGFEPRSAQAIILRTSYEVRLRMVQFLLFAVNGSGSRILLLGQGCSRARVGHDMVLSSSSWLW